MATIYLVATQLLGMGWSTGTTWHTRSTARPRLSCGGELMVNPEDLMPDISTMKCMVLLWTRMETICCWVGQVMSIPTVQLAQDRGQDTPVTSGAAIWSLSVPVGTNSTRTSMVSRVVTMQESGSPMMLQLMRSWSMLTLTLSMDLVSSNLYLLKI